MNHIGKKMFSWASGFSLVELMMVVVFTTVGFIGLLHLQINTVTAVSTARNLSEATNLAEHVIETIRVEALEWNVPGSMMVSQPIRYPYLSVAGNPTHGGGSGWIRAMLSDSSDKKVGTIGADDVLDAGVLLEFNPEVNKRFCVHYRLVWLIPDFLVRADVRVLWLQPKARYTLHQTCEVGMETDFGNVSSVTIPATVMRNVFTY
jgi:hypothetical protein